MLVSVQYIYVQILVTSVFTNPCDQIQGDWTLLWKYQYFILFSIDLWV